MAIYQATFLTPQNVAIDVSEANLFTAQVNGTLITRYILEAYAITGGSALYTNDSGVLITPLGDKETVEIVVPANPGTLSNGNEYKWTLETFENAVSETSDEVAFIANDNPVVDLTFANTVTTQEFTFTPTYSQAQGVPVQYSYFQFNDGDGTPILTTDRNYSGNLSYTFSGFLNGSSYQVQFFGVTQNGVAFNTPLINFDVSYAQPNINIKPTITQNENTSIVTVEWGEVVLIPGTSSGTISYIDDYLVQGNTALDMEAGASVSWDVEVPESFTARRQWTKKVDFTTGVAVKLIGTTKNYEVGYDGARWYYNNGTAQGFSELIALSTNPLLIYMLPTVAYVWDKTATTLTKIFTQ